MNLSVSNIAWNPRDTEEALFILKKYGINNIDVTPTLFGSNFEDIDTTNILNFYKKSKIKLVGMQSLLFGCKPISLFDGSKEKDIILNYLEQVFKLANKLNVKKLVFGSPKNRFIKNKDTFKIENAITIFTDIANLAKKYNCIICLEANAVEYGCNFITKTFEACFFVRKINHPNLKIILDTSTVVLNNENIENIFIESRDLIEHIHISSPFLKSINTINNQLFSTILKKYNYKKTVTLEYNLQNNNDLVLLENDIAIFSKFYK